jgi:hypothetical protein
MLLSPVLAKFLHDCPLVLKSASMPWRLLKQIWRDFIPTVMLLSVMSVLFVALPISEILEGLTNYHVISPAQ